MKPVWELTSSDLDEVPLWYFPMDGSDGGDEMSVRPVDPATPLPLAYQMLVRTIFETTSGAKLPGYVYWSSAGGVETLKPTMLMQDLIVTFWNGIITPDATFLDAVRARLGPEPWPIRFASASVRGLAPSKGTLHGIYFLRRGSAACVRT